jgi:NADH dehydrogenase [ubiquinone] 1 alpha subcomplex assembly factor 2
MSAEEVAKCILTGQDLLGNTFWEFKDALNANRFRRIVKYNNKIHYGDVSMTRTLNPPPSLPR